MLNKSMLLAHCRRCARKVMLETLEEKRIVCHKLASARSFSDINEVDTDDCLKDYDYAFKPDLLKNKVAFITGGGSGIGFRITEILMRHGCKTVIASRKIERVQEAASKLQAATNVECLPLQCDVRKPSDVESVFQDINSHFGKLDILVNNAAGNFLSPVENLSYNAFKTVIEIDTIGTFNVSKAAFHNFFKENGGAIINISATLDYRGQAFQAHAGSAKAAVDALTRHLAVEWGEYGVRVNGVAPGPIGGTEGMRKLGGKSKLAEQAAKSVPLGRFGTKTEIADSVLYLASNAATYVNGTVLVVDGGSWLTWLNDPSLLKLIMQSKL